MKKIKDLKDGAKFRIEKGSAVIYELQSLNEKKKAATYTSLKSKRTFTKGWGKQVYPL